jgi:hypothetical protein
VRLHVLFDDYFEAFVAAAAAEELVDAEHDEEHKVLKVGQKQDGDEGHTEDHHKENAVHDEEEEFVVAVDERHRRNIVSQHTKYHQHRSHHKLRQRKPILSQFLYTYGKFTS